MKNSMYNLMLIGFALIFIGSGAGIVYKLTLKEKAENQIEELKAVFADTPQDKFTVQKQADGETVTALESLTLEEQLEIRESRLSGYAKLHEQNGDMKGWVQIPGTKVDYPVMQKKEQDNFYLKHNFDGQKSSYGTPYIADSCDLEGGEDNIIIYGHHMKDGTMFGDLSGYADESFYQAHPIIWFDTLDKVAAYQIVAVTKASAAASDEDMFALAADYSKRQEFLDEVNSRAYYNTGEIGGNGRPLLILITCEYSQNEGRLLVVAKELTFYKNEDSTDAAEEKR